MKDQDGHSLHRWRIAVAASGAYGGALHVIAAAMAVSALLHIVLSPPASDRTRAPVRAPALAPR